MKAIKRTSFTEGEEPEVWPTEYFISVLRSDKMSEELINHYIHALKTGGVYTTHYALYSGVF